MNRNEGLLEFYALIATRSSWVIFVGVAALALISGWSLGNFLAGFFCAFLSLWLIALPAVLLGQSASVSLDQRSTLEEIRDLLKNAAQSQEEEPSILPDSSNILGFDK